MTGTNNAPYPEKRTAFKLVITYPESTHGTTVIYPQPVTAERVQEDESKRFPFATVEVIR